MIAVPKVGARVAVMMPNATVDLSGRWVKQVSLVESARAAIVSVLLDKPIMGGRHRLVRASLPQLASAGEEVFAICDRCQIPYAFGGFQRDAIDCDQHHRMLTQPRYYDTLIETAGKEESAILERTRATFLFALEADLVPSELPF